MEKKCRMCGKGIEVFQDPFRISTIEFLSICSSEKCVEEFNEQQELLAISRLSVKFNQSKTK